MTTFLQSTWGVTCACYLDIVSFSQCLNNKEWVMMRGIKKTAKTNDDNCTDMGVCCTAGVSG